MNILNLDISGIESMHVKDLSKFSNYLLSNYKDARSICTNNFVIKSEENHPKMVTVEVTVQVFCKDKSERRLLLTCYRAIDFSCSNGIRKIEFNILRDFTEELKHQREFNNKQTLILNDSTVKSLKTHLAAFPDNAKLIFHDNNEYKNFVVQIGCNFEWQEENNTVMLLKGFRIPD